MDSQNIRENSGRPFLVNDTDGYHDVILNEKTIIRVLKRYTDFYLIGSGAQGVVMSALDLVTNERVAIKKLTRPFSNPTHAKRAYREFEIMNLMDHPNIIRLLNAFTPQNSLDEFDDLYLVMELMNASLCQVTAMDLDHERLSFLLYQMLCGVNYMHKASIVHRDLKPSNIVVNYQCRLKILDFGLARNVEDENILKTPYVVTRYYRAPEVILGVPYKENVDVWAIGCIFAELLTRKVFFPGTDYIDQWTKIVDGLGTPDSDFTKLLTPEVRNYIGKLPYVATRDWKEIFPDSIFPKNINDRLNAENARDLISRMLVLNPFQRITVSDALKFPYVSLWYDENEVDGPPPPPYIDPDHSPDLSLEQWRELLFKQIKDYENTHDIFGIQSNPVPNEMSEDENSC
uniref:Stress-activated protein kinase JNK n=1 Tax=Meloidogyne incognita TaxID=6306 RepID=A0A914LS82_MELIC